MSGALSCLFYIDLSTAHYKVLTGRRLVTDELEETREEPLTA